MAFDVSERFVGLVNMRFFVIQIYLKYKVICRVCAVTIGQR